MSTHLKTILLVEDDESHGYLIEKAFRQNGVKDSIQIVRSGIEALSYVRGDGKFSDREKFPFPTVIITDLNLSNGDGFEVLRQLNDHPQWALIPKVVLSSSKEPADIKKAYLLGAHGYHEKPADYIALRRQLRALHDYWVTCCIPVIDVPGRQHNGTENNQTLES